MKYARGKEITNCCFFSTPQNLYVYSGFFEPRAKLPFIWTKPENNSLLRKTKTKEMIINHKGTRMVKDGED